MNNEIVIDGATYRRVDPAGGEWQIVVVDGRWNLVGRVEDTPTGVTIHDAQVIIRWGTKHGLGQLASEGPLPETNLGAPSTVHVPTHAVLLRMETRADLWQ